MRDKLKHASITGATIATTMIPHTAFAVAADAPNLTGAWVGFAALAVFAAAYGLVISEEATNLRKSKPMVVAAGILWMMIGIVYSDLGFGREAADSFRHVFLEYAELLLFLIVAMSYVNALEERHVFDVLRARLLRSGLGYRTLFWLTGALAFFI